MPATRPGSPDTIGSDSKTNLDREIYGPAADMLGWTTRAARLAQYLLFQVETPITVGIQGDWGSGKSSFINLVESCLGKRQQEKGGGLAGHLRHYRASHPRHPSQEADAYVLRFDSWAFAQSQRSADELFPVYVACVLEAYLNAQNRPPGGSSVAGRFADALKTSLRIGALTVVGTVAGEAAGQALAEALPGSAESLAKELSGFKADFQELVNALLTNPADKPDTNRLIIIVDDLDRIAPVTAVEITEKIKVFLDVRGVIFILAADLGIIQEGLRQKFGATDLAAEGKNYLDKIVKIQYNVPQLQMADLAYLALRYPTFAGAFGFTARGINWDDRNSEPLKGLLARLPDTDTFDLLRVFPSIGSNIRNSKRVLLNFEFSHYLLTSGEGTADKHQAFRLLAVTVLHQYRHELALAFYRWLARPDYTSATRLDADRRDNLLTALAVSPDTPAGAFFDRLLGRQYLVADWLAAYTAALNPLSEPAT